MKIQRSFWPFGVVSGTISGQCGDVYCAFCHQERFDLIPPRGYENLFLVSHSWENRFSRWKWYVHTITYLLLFLLILCKIYDWWPVIYFGRGWTRLQYTLYNAIYVHTYKTNWINGENKIKIQCRYMVHTLYISV